MTEGRQVEFQRARSAEQIGARRRTILEAAADLLAEMPVREMSLRELSRRVGLSKTNVTRYFETREAVLFELLNRNFAGWLDDLPAELPAPATIGAARPEAVLDALARSLARRPLLCELLSALGTELERNISAETVRDFKLAHNELQDRLGALLGRYVPALAGPAARELASMATVYTAGLWPFATPSPAVAAVIRSPELAHTRVDFADRLSRALRVAVVGLLRLDDGDAQVPER